MNPLMVRDERERGVDQAADRLSAVLSFGLLAIVAYRSFARGEAPGSPRPRGLGWYRRQRLPGSSDERSGRWALVLG
jgi:hypothetical protein